MTIKKGSVEKKIPFQNRQWSYIQKCNIEETLTILQPGEDNCIFGSSKSVKRK